MVAPAFLLCVCECPYPPSVQPGRGWSPAAAPCSSPSVWTSAPSASTETRNAPEPGGGGELPITDQNQTDKRRRSASSQTQSHLGVAMPALQQDLVVEGFPLGVVGQSHGELAQAGDEMLGHPLLVGLWAPAGVFQLITSTDKNNRQTDVINRLWKKFQDFFFFFLVNQVQVPGQSNSPDWVTWSRSGFMRASARSLLRNL